MHTVVDPAALAWTAAFAMTVGGSAYELFGARRRPAVRSVAVAVLTAASTLDMGSDAVRLAPPVGWGGVLLAVALVTLPGRQRAENAWRSAALIAMAAMWFQMSVPAAVPAAHEHGGLPIDAVVALGAVGAASVGVVACLRSGPVSIAHALWHRPVMAAAMALMVVAMRLP